MKLRIAALLLAMAGLFAAPPGVGAQVVLQRPNGRTSDAGRIKVHKAMNFFFVSQTVSEANYQRIWLPNLDSLDPYMVRLQFSWRRLEPDVKSTFDWTDLDRLMLKLYARNIQVLALLDETPDWASLLTNSAAPTEDHPDNASDFGDFCTAVVTRYKPGGTFATLNGITNGYGVRYWEMRNEVNTSGSWTKQQYVDSAVACYPAIKAVDSAAKALPMAVNAGGSGATAAAYWDGLYALGIKPYFDIMNSHSYNSSDPTCVNMFPDLVNPTRIIMAKYSDASKPIWITEHGPGSNGRSAIVSCNNRNLEAVSKQDYEAYFMFSFSDDGSDDQGLVGAKCGEVVCGAAEPCRRPNFNGVDECVTFIGCQPAAYASSLDLVTGLGSGADHVDSGTGAPDPQASCGFTGTAYYGYKYQVIK